MSLWEEIELKWPSFKTLKERNSLKNEIKIMGVVVMGCALREFLTGQ